MSLVLSHYIICQYSSSHFAKFQKTQPILIAFLGISFGKKEEDNKPLINMTEAKAQLEKADQLFEENKFQETSDLLKGLEQSDAEVLWRQGRALFKLASEESNSTKKAELIREAYKFAAESLTKDDQNYAVHKVFTTSIVIMASRTDFLTFYSSGTRFFSMQSPT